MSLFGLIWQCFRIFLFFYLPSAVFLCVILGGRGVWIGAGVSGLILFGLLLGSEKLLSQMYQAHLEIPQGLKRSLELAIQGRHGELPQILAFPEPTPHILCARSLGQKGTIFVSQGLLAFLNETELRRVLNLCDLKLQRKEILFQSLCATMVLLLLRISPLSWSQLIISSQKIGSKDQKGLTPFSLLVFSLFPPIIQFFRKAGSQMSLKDFLEPSYQFLRGKNEFSPKAGRILELLGPTQNKRFSPIHFISPIF